MAQLKDEMVDGQDTIWYLSNMTSAEQIGSLPILEGFKQLKVMLFTDAVDEWVTMTLNEYQEIPVKSVSQGEFDDEEDAETQEAKDKLSRSPNG